LGISIIFIGGSNVTKKSPIIRQGKVTDLMTQIANLPERKKAPDDMVSLTEIFRTKEYIAEVRRALKRGYSFGDLAKIFTERCGVAISARQIRYHYTHEQNQSVNAKSRKKPRKTGASENHALSADSPQKTAVDDVKENHTAPDSRTKPLSNSSGFSFESRATAETERKIDFGAFPIDARPKES
jgi:hypothetical protein